jgi:hypothetical protein
MEDVVVKWFRGEFLSQSQRPGAGAATGSGTGGSRGRAAGFDQFGQHLGDAFEKGLVVIRGSGWEQIELSTDVEHGGALGC